MGDPGTFLGGIAAIAILGLLLFYELSMESMLFVYVLAFLIIIIVGAMTLSFGGPGLRFFMMLKGKVPSIKRPKERHETREPEGKRTIERFFDTAKGKRMRPEEVANPLLRGLVEKLGGKEKPKSGRLSGLKKRIGKLKGIRVPRPKLNLRRLKGPKKEEMPRVKERKVVEKPAKPKMPKKPGKPLLSGLVKKLRGIRIPRPKLSGVKLPRMPSRPGPEKRAEPVKPPKERIAREEIELLKERAIGEKPKPPEGKPAPRKEEPKPALLKGEEGVKPEGPCQICGSREELEVHYITPLNRGGKRVKTNMIVLCERHRKQAEQGIYSENLLRNLRES